MNAAIRVDASFNIGIGHVIRCLTLADELRSKGLSAFFICKELQGHMCDFIESRGYNVFRLSSDPFHVNEDVQQTIQAIRSVQIEWLVIDHYLIDERWEKQLRPWVKGIVVIDDLADRHHDCELLLDQNFYLNMESRYQGKVPVSCKLLLGPCHALLRPQFHNERSSPCIQAQQEGSNRILIFFGGSDPLNATMRVLHLVKEMELVNWEFDVIVGSSNPWKHEIKNLCHRMGSAHYYCQVDNMAEMMARAAFSIGAGGSVNWERLYLGLPSIVLVVAENQRETTEALASKGLVHNLGWYPSVENDQIAQSIRSWTAQPKLLSSLRASMRSFMDYDRTLKLSDLMMLGVGL
jgi:UDP-2,4-diacetamido-2,4,6-trideoxy-beta-L-altropyranose hydrolase